MWIEETNQDGTTILYWNEEKQRVYIKGRD